MILQEKTTHTKPNTDYKKAISEALNEKFKAQNTKKSLDLTNELISFIIELCEYEIIENDNLISDLTNGNEKTAWIDENCFIKKLIMDIKDNFHDKVGNQIVIQELTPQQEDYIIESGLEKMREAREYEN